MMSRQLQVEFPHLLFKTHNFHFFMQSFPQLISERIEYIWALFKQ